MGRGIDVTLLHHDIGMVQTQSAMTLTDRPSISPIISMKRFNPLDLRNEEVRVSADYRPKIHTQNSVKSN